MISARRVFAFLTLGLSMYITQGCNAEEPLPSTDTPPPVTSDAVAGEQPAVENDSTGSSQPVGRAIDDSAGSSPRSAVSPHDPVNEPPGEQGVNIVNEVAPRVYDQGCPANKQEWDMTPPVFRHIGVDLAPLDHATGWAGAFHFDDVRSVGGSTRFFEPFAYQQAWGGYAPISDWIFGTAPGTNVYSPLDGIVVNVAHNTNWDDWEVIINPRNCSKSFYVVTIDHIVDVTVTIDERVTAGQVIGKKGADDNNGLYAGNSRTFEITVSNANGEAFCPLLFFPIEERAAAAAKLEQLMRDIETYRSPNSYINTNLLGDKFDETAWAGDGALIGCYAESNTFESAAFVP
jgi:Peptidase family M23